MSTASCSFACQMAKALSYPLHPLARQVVLTYATCKLAQNLRFLLRRIFTQNSFYADLLILMPSIMSSYFTAKYMMQIPLLLSSTQAYLPSYTKFEFWRCFWILLTVPCSSHSHVRYILHIPLDTRDATTTSGFPFTPPLPSVPWIWAARLVRQSMPSSWPWIIKPFGA